MRHVSPFFNAVCGQIGMGGALQPGVMGSCFGMLPYTEQCAVFRRYFEFAFHAQGDSQQAATTRGWSGAEVVTYARRSGIPLP